jgi:hypothetical protein
VKTGFLAAPLLVSAIIAGGGTQFIRALFPKIPHVYYFLLDQQYAPQLVDKTSFPKLGPTPWDIVVQWGKKHGSKGAALATVGLVAIVNHFVPLFRFGETLRVLASKDPTWMIDAVISFSSLFCAAALYGYTERFRREKQPTGATFVQPPEPVSE